MPVAPFAGGLRAGNSKRAEVTVGTSVVTITPPAGTWNFMQIINNHATAVVSANVNADPSDSSGSLPGITWGNGQDIGPGGQVMVALDGATDIRLLSDTASTPVVLNLIV